MVNPSRRSRTLRRKSVRVPSGKTRVQYIKRKPKVPHCAKCGAVLKGMPRARANELKHMSKTKKRPKRPFGGKLCSRCTRIEIINRTRLEK